MGTSSPAPADDLTAPAAAGGQAGTAGHSNRAVFSCQWTSVPSSFAKHEQFPAFLNFVPDMDLTSGGVWYDGPQGSGIRTRFPRRCAAERRRFLKTREKPTGDVRPLPRARNQAREPRRRRHAPARRGAGAGYARKRVPLPVGEGETMTATDPQPAAMLADGGAPPRRPHKAPAQRPGRRFTPPASSRTARSSLPRTPIRGRSGTSGGLAPAARGRGLPPNRERRSTTGRLHARTGYSI